MRIEAPMGTEAGFESFVRSAEPRLRRALLAAVGVDRLDDAVAEALAYGYEHRAALANMSNPVGYLFRVGQSRVRPRKRPRLFRVEPASIPDTEPGLADALMRLPHNQRVAIWLAHGCGWPHADIAEVLGISPSTVATHVERGMSRLRLELGVDDAHA